jgi:hypothetical protein
MNYVSEIESGRPSPSYNSVFFDQLGLGLGVMKKARKCPDCLIRHNIVGPTSMNTHKR